MRNIIRTSTWLTKVLADELFRYEDGQLFWKEKRSNRCKDGAIGAIAPNGYVNVSVRVGGKPRTCDVHQVVWVMHGGTIHDDAEIDHKDRNRANNRIENLRQATLSQNRHNSKPRSFLGWRGIARQSNGVGWRVFLKTEHGKIEMGVGTCIYDAATIYNFLVAEHHAEFAVYNETLQPWLDFELKFVPEYTRELIGTTEDI